MLFDANSGLLVDNLGWVDGGDLWLADANARTERRISTGRYGQLGLRMGASGTFRVVHNHGELPRISVRYFSEPERELASVCWDDSTAQFEGDDTVWASVEKAAVARSALGESLVLVDASSRTIHRLDQSWLSPDVYDLGYQDICDCLYLPDAQSVVVSVRRSSTLIIIDIEANRPKGQISLADRLGNPELIPLSSTKFLASDYDTLCVVEMASMRVRSSRPLQPPIGGHTMSFIGDVALRDGKCAVARPYSNDATLLDLDTFEVLSWAQFDWRPLSLALTSDRDVVARDWKTGQVEWRRFSSWTR